MRRDAASSVFRVPGSRGAGADDGSEATRRGWRYAVVAPLLRTSWQLAAGNAKCAQFDRAKSGFREAWGGRAERRGCLQRRKTIRSAGLRLVIVMIGVTQHSGTRARSDRIPWKHTLRY